MDQKLTKNDDDELTELEEKLIEKDRRDREEKMRVEGKSVFDLQRMKRKNLDRRIGEE